jgi:signal transduction histidine kinase
MDRPDDDAWWVRSIIGWHIAFWVMLGIVAVAIVLGSTSGPVSRWWALGLLAVLGAAYALIATPAATARDSWRSRTYVVVLIACVAGILAVYPPAAFILFIAYPQVWFFNDRVRNGAAWTVVLALSSTLAFLVHSGFSLESLRDNGTAMFVSLAFSLLLGFWIARADLAEANHAQGVMAERERMAGEIHDTLAQVFTSIIMLAQGAESALRRDTVVAADGLALIEATARENLAEARALVAAFSPVALDGTTLTEAVRRLVDRFTAETGLAVRLDLSHGLDGLGRDREVVLLRSTQEALTNVRRHAAARTVVVRLASTAEGAVVDVVDDGTGFDTASPRGFGLAGMRSRVEQVGGQLDVRSKPGHGTRVHVQLPCRGSGVAAPALAPSSVSRAREPAPDPAP